jgi:hypothetical protein
MQREAARCTATTMQSGPRGCVISTGDALGLEATRCFDPSRQNVSGIHRAGPCWTFQSRLRDGFGPFFATGGVPEEIPG